MAKRDIFKYWCEECQTETWQYWDEDYICSGCLFREIEEADQRETDDN